MMVLYPLFCILLIQNGGPVNSHPALNSMPKHHLTSSWLKPQMSNEVLELQETIFKVDEALNRPNDYGSIMLESGEEDDQLSRLLFKLQNLDESDENIKQDEDDEELQQRDFNQKYFQFVLVQPELKTNYYQLTRRD